MDGESGNRLRKLAQACMLVSSAGLMPAQGAFGACGDTERASPIYQAVDACRTRSVANETLIAQAAVTGGTLAPVLCIAGSNTGMPGSGLSPELCRDPAQFVCSRSQNSGYMLDSRCRVTILEQSEAGATPDAVTARCDVEARQATFIDGKASECPGHTLTDSCRATLRARYRRELARLERDVAYTPGRRAKFTELFDRVKDTYMRMIDGSSHLPQAMKSYLKARINRTTLPLTDSSLASRDHSTCHNSEPGGPSTGVYNSFEGLTGLNHTVHFCIGQAMNLDLSNPYTIMLVIGHELSHSIDPCALEMDVLYRTNPGSAAPHIGDRRVYPGLVSCLRGGDADHGCSGPGAVLHCNTRESRREVCRAEASAYAPAYPWTETYNGCWNTTGGQPSCFHPVHGDTHGSSNLADYRRTGVPYEQSGESFSDFMGAEVLGQIIAEDSAAGGRSVPPLTAGDRRDILLSNASTLARLHGVCLDRTTTPNTPDEHPPGFMRVNRFMMGSEGFRNSIGCPTVFPGAAEGGNPRTCHAL